MSKRLDLIKLLEFTNDKLRQHISLLLKEISENLNLEHNLMILPKLVNVKNSSCAILRAAKKNDFTLLMSDACGEIDDVKHDIPQILMFKEYILNKRLKHRT
jgi:hypothetical protein